MPTAKITALFYNYVDEDGRGVSLSQGEEAELSDKEFERGEKLGAFEGTEIDPRRRGTDQSNFVDDRDPEDTETAVPPENGGEEPPEDYDPDNPDGEDDEEAERAEGSVRPLDDPGSAAPADKPLPTGADYESKSKGQLEETAKLRGVDVEGSGAGGSVTKADLVRALEDDDT